jgi:glycosyltransferase involved in cell wall biosynthesis
MGAALVTFAVGGVGDYVSAPLRCQCERYAVERSCGCVENLVDMESIPPFEMSGNAVVVNEASPAALGDAVLYLVSNRDLWNDVVNSALSTVRIHFTSERQIKQYTRAYTDIFLISKGRQ